MTDVQLVARAQAGDRDAAGELVARFESFVRNLAANFYLPGADRDDVLQEARVALLQAVKNFDPAAGTPFRGFVALVVRRQLASAVIHARRDKRRTVDEALRQVVLEDGPVPIVDVLEAVDPSALEQLAGREQLADLAHAIRAHLSRLEAYCLLASVNGVSYDEIAARVGGGEKRVDRAITRARWKLRGVPPPSNPRAALPPERTLYACPGCGGATYRDQDAGGPGGRRGGPGRPPRCHVCRYLSGDLLEAAIAA